MNEQLIFLLAFESRWNSYIIQPARGVDNGEFYNYLGQFTVTDTLSSPEKHLLKLCKKLEVGSLYKTYGKKSFKSEKDFITKVEGELLKLIQNFIDKTVAEIIQKLFELDLPLYFKESRLHNPHKKDRIQIEQEPLKVSLGFYRNEEQIRYRLILLNREEEITPSERNTRIITLTPGSILVDNQLFYLPDGFSGIRLKPFLSKKEITIPRQNEKEYFRKFILKNICNEDIEAEGFEIVERDAKKSAILSLERDITSQPIIELRFRYNYRSISSFSTNTAIVELEEEEDQYRFYRTLRDGKWENAIKEFIQQAGIEPQQSGYYKLTPTNDWGNLVEWIKEHKQVLLQKGIEINQDRLPVNYYTGNWKLDYSQQTTSDWFQLHATITLEDGKTIPLQALWENILSGNREYRYGENKIFIIPEEWFARYSAIMLFGEKQKENVVLHRNQYSLLPERAEDSQDTFIEPVEAPQKLKATLREYQLAGYRWLYHLYRHNMGACLADDMGLGKTIQTIALLLKYKEETRREENTPSPLAPLSQLDLFEMNTQEEEVTTDSDPGEIFHTCLITAPASVVHNWKNELQKFAPSLTVAEYTGASRNGLRQTLKRWDIIITTYQTLRNDIDFLKLHRFGVVVFDESQSFKNRDSQVHHAVSQIQGSHYVALSGTPIENSLNDLWSLMYVINRGLLGNHSTFQNYFIRPITADIKSSHSESLRKLIAPFILRRTKEEVLKDLPERTDELIICESDPEQKKAYEEELSKARNRILEKALLQTTPGKDTFGSLQAIIRLRQIANHPRLADAEYVYSSGKFREIFRMLEELVNTRHKVLLFSDYVTYLNLVAEEMNSRKWQYTMLTGSTQNREEVIHKFSTTPECQFFLISLKAGGVGLNLTEADYVFILDPWWNLAAEEQAISRSHRMGQKHAVFVYRFITAGTLEEKILHIQRQKQDLSDAIILSADTSFHPNEKELEKLILEEIK